MGDIGNGHSFCVEFVCACIEKSSSYFLVGAVCSRECVKVSELCCVFISEEELLRLSTEVLLAGSQFLFAVHFVVWLLFWLFVVVVVGWMVVAV